MVMLKGNKEINPPTGIKNHASFWSAVAPAAAFPLSRTLVVIATVSARRQG